MSLVVSGGGIGGRNVEKEGKWDWVPVEGAMKKKLGGCRAKRSRELPQGFI